MVVREKTEAFVTGVERFLIAAERSPDDQSEKKELRICFQAELA